MYYQKHISDLRYLVSDVSNLNRTDELRRRLYVCTVTFILCKWIHYACTFANTDFCERCLFRFFLVLVLTVFSSLPSSFAHFRTPAPKPTCPCAPTLVCWSRFSPSCCWRASQSWVLQRTCVTCGRHSRRNRVRQKPRSISSSRSQCVSSWAGLYRPTGGSTWWQASSRLQIVKFKMLVSNIDCIIDIFV